jgi:hypothetical protein
MRDVIGDEADAIRAKFGLQKRANVRELNDGSFEFCAGEHERSAPCTWWPVVHEARDDGGPLPIPDARALVAAVDVPARPVWDESESVVFVYASRLDRVREILLRLQRENLPAEIVDSLAREASTLLR